MSEQTETTKKPGLRKTRVGVVTSTKMDKTIVVEYVARVPHPKFKKIVKKSISSMPMTKIPRPR